MTPGAHRVLARVLGHPEQPRFHAAVVAEVRHRHRVEAVGHPDRVVRGRERREVARGGSADAAGRSRPRGLRPELRRRCPGTTARRRRVPHDVRWCRSLRRMRSPGSASARASGRGARSRSSRAGRLIETGTAGPIAATAASADSAFTDDPVETTSELAAIGSPSAVSAAEAGTRNEGPPPPKNGSASTRTVAKTIPNPMMRFIALGPPAQATPVPHRSASAWQTTPRKTCPARHANLKCPRTGAVSVPEGPKWSPIMRTWATCPRSPGR